MNASFKKIVFILMVALVILIGILHSVTPGHLILYHDTYRRLSYFPIAIGAILYGFRGGIFLSVLSCLAFVPHLYTFWALGPQAYYSELSEIIFYLAAGIVIGLISSSENRLRENYRRISEKLAVSYDRLSEQASRLVEAEKQLGESRKLSLLGHVSASLAHEIKNPLAAIKGAAEILADEVPPDHPKNEFIGIMRSEISRLNNSVEDVLSYCRGQKSSRETHKKPLDQIVDQVAALLETQVKEKQVRLTIVRNRSDQTPELDEAPMVQVLMNLMINALEAVGRKGQIQIKMGNAKDGYRISISDDGPGLDKETAARVFKSFVTLKEGGTGLGLSISKRIIESFNGSIHISRSTLGGAAVIIVLPETVDKG